MQPHPKEHPMKRTMVIGGVSSFLAETATKKLARWGMAVDQKLHVDMEKTRKRPAYVPPGSVDVVVVFHDMVASRIVTEKWQDAARVAKVPCVVLGRHESRWHEEMGAQGFKTINPNTAAAVAENEPREMAPQIPDKPTQKPQPGPTAGKLDETMEQIKVLLLEAKEQGLHRLTFDGTTGKLSHARLLLVEDNETL